MCIRDRVLRSGQPGIHAGLPTAQCLRSAIVVNGASRSKAKPRRPDSRPGSRWDRVSLWERACSRRCLFSRYQCLLILRFREQARSHTGLALNWRFGSTQNLVGASLLANASVQLASMSVLSLGCGRRPLRLQMIQRPLDQQLHPVGHAADRQGDAAA